MTDTEKALDYYRTAAIQTAKICPRPHWVPSRVRLIHVVRADFPFSSIALPGEYDCHVNALGAVSVKATDGSMLGLKLNEFEPVAWVENGSASSQRR